MLNLDRYGVIFLIVLSGYFSHASCAENPSLDLEPIVIAKDRNSSSSNYSLTSDFLNNLFYSSPIEALSLLPLDLQSRSPRAGIQADFSLRGSSHAGVLVLVDGQRINNPQTSHHNSDIPLTREDIKKIEVIPGVASSLFGPDAVGGAINFAIKKPRQKDRVLILSLGSHKMKSGLFSISDKIEDLGVRFSLERQESGGFYYDTDFKKFTATLVSFLDMPSQDFDMCLGYQEKEFGAYDFYTPASGYPSKEWTKTWLMKTDFVLYRDSFMIKPNFLWKRHFDKFMLDNTQVRSRYLNHHRTDVYTPTIYFQNQTSSLGNIGLGLEYGQERINSTNLGKHNREHKSIFMDNNKDLTSRFSLGFSVRCDDYDSFNEEYTHSLNSAYKISEEVKLRLGVSKSIRLPSFTELYYNDPTTIGDAGLSAEKSRSYEVGYDYKKEEFSQGLTFFLREEEDFIDWVKRIPGQVKWQVENITNSEVCGIENYLKLEINQNLNLESNYTYINKRIDDNGYIYKYGPNYIKHLINTVLTFNLPFGIQTIGFSYKKKPNRDGWFLLNTHLGYKLNKTSQVFFNVTNLLNVEYQEIEGIPQPGRYIESGIRFAW